MRLKGSPRATSMRDPSVNGHEMVGVQRLGSFPVPVRGQFLVILHSEL